MIRHVGLSDTGRKPREQEPTDASKNHLESQRGQTAGQEFIFDEPTTCIVGRSEDCQPQIPDDEEHRQISRHHCLLDINPPDIRIRDFGSLNGTYVNGQLIGQREKDQTPEEAANIQFPEKDLKHDDEIRLSQTAFRVGIFVPTMCVQCAAEIPADRKVAAEVRPGVFQCEQCRKKAEKAKQKEAPKPKPKECGKCGRDVSAEIGEHRHGDFICVSCKADPMAILQQLLELAGLDNADLVAIQDYQVTKKLGQGGMGAVYLARHEKTGKQVALKVMLPQVAVDEPAKQKFLLEVENTKCLKHPNVVQLFEHGCSNGTFFFTLEFCDGAASTR